MPLGLVVCSLYSAVPCTTNYSTFWNKLWYDYTLCDNSSNPTKWIYVLISCALVLQVKVKLLALIVLTNQHWGMVTLWSLSWPRTCWYRADAFDWVLIVKPLETQGSHQTYCEKVDAWSALFNFSNANMAFPTSDIADFQVSKEEISTLEMFRIFAITCHFDLDFRKFDFLLRSLSEKSLRWFWTDWQTFLPNENRTQRSMEGKF